MKPRLKYDDLSASGAWPGGARYGYSLTRVFINRPWSVAQVTLAESLGIRLPFVDYQYREIWWDAPLDNWIKDPRPALEAAFLTLEEYPLLFAPVTPRQIVRHAHKYANVWWEKPDPLAKIIKTVQQFITEEAA